MLNEVVWNLYCMSDPNADMGGSKFLKILRTSLWMAPQLESSLTGDGLSDGLVWDTRIIGSAQSTCLACLGLKEERPSCSLSSLNVSVEIHVHRLY